MKAITLSLLLASAIVHGATITGRVTDKESNTPLVGAAVVIEGTGHSARTDRSGFFVFNDIATGRVVLRTQYAGYQTVSDTITVSAADSDYHADLRLPPETPDAKPFKDIVAGWLSPGEVQKFQMYHDSLALLATRSRVLSVTLDTLDCIPPGAPWGGEMYAALTFHNSTSLPIYLLENYDGLPRIHAVIVNSNGDTVRAHELFVDELGFKSRYDTSDLIVVPPHGKARYPRSILWLQSCRILPPDVYTVRVVYSYELPERIPEASRFRRDQLAPYLMAFRGTIASDNVRYLDEPQIPAGKNYPGMQIITRRLSRSSTGDFTHWEGVVLDSSTNEILQGVNVAIRGTSKGAATGQFGTFKLDSLKTTDTLAVSYVGYSPIRLSVQSLASLPTRFTPGTVNMDSVVAALDSTDIALVSYTLREDYFHREHNWYRDSAIHHKNVFILDSLIQKAWLPSLPGGQFIMIASGDVERLVGRDRRINAVRVAAIYKGPAFKIIILEKVECFFSKKRNRVHYVVHDIDRYRYQLEEGVWKRGVQTTTIIDYAASTFE
jgi:hypothetical protein